MEIFVSVSEPTQRSGIVTIQIGQNALEYLAKDDNINIVQLSPTILFTVDVAGKNGLPSFVSFRKGATADVVPAQASH